MVGCSVCLFLFSKTEYHVAQASLKLMILHPQSLEYGEDTCTPSHLSQAGKTGSHVAQAGPEPLIPSLQITGWPGYVVQDPRAWRMLGKRSLLTAS